MPLTVELFTLNPSRKKNYVKLTFPQEENVTVPTQVIHQNSKPQTKYYKVILIDFKMLNYHHITFY